MRYNECYFYLRTNKILNMNDFEFILGYKVK